MATNSSVSGSAAQRKPYEGDAPIVMVPRAWTRPTSTSLPWQIAAYNKTQEQAQLSDAQKQAGLRLLAEAGNWMRETFGPRPEPTDLPGRIGRFLDDWWTDDFAGTVPVLGPAANKLGQLFNGYETVTEKTAQASSWVLSALPGGTQTLDWDRAGTISPGRVLVAMGVKETNTAGVEARRARKAAYQALLESGKKIEDYTPEEMDLFNEQVANNTGQGETGFFVPEGWDVRNPDDEAWLFGDSNGRTEPGARAAQLLRDVGESDQTTAANVASGITDAIFVWYLDPLVLAGKAAKIARFGSRVLNIEPVTRQYTSRAATLRRIGEDFTKAEDYIRTGQGEANWAAVEARNFAQKRGSELAHEEYVKTSPNPDEIMAIADNVDDPALAAVILPALAGSQYHIGRLFDEAPAVADAVANIKRRNPYEFVAMNAPLGVAKPMLYDDVLEAGLDLEGLTFDTIRRNKALQDALGLAGEDFASIRSFGSRTVKAKELAQEWRAGKTNRAAVSRGQETVERVAPRTLTLLDEGALRGEITDFQLDALASKTFGVIDDEAMRVVALGEARDVVDYAKTVAPNRFASIRPRTGTVPAFTERVFQISAGWRKVRLWERARGQVGSGLVEIRGAGAGRSSEEWRAAFTDSRVLNQDQTWIERQLARWRAAPEHKRALLLEQIEREAIKKIARTYGLDAEQQAQVEALYKFLHQQRAELIEKARANKTAFGVDENGAAIVLGPVARSQLQTHVPVIDLKAMDNLLHNLASPENRPFLSGAVEHFLRQPGAKPIQAAKLGFENNALPKIEALAESINSTWKAAVLLRAGYPVRNTVEGWARTLAATGTALALRPSVVVKGGYRTFYKNPVNASRRAKLDVAIRDISGIVESERRLQGDLVREADKVLAKMRAHDTAGQRQVTSGGVASTRVGHRVTSATRAKYDQQLAGIQNDYEIIQARIDDYEGVIAEMVEKRANLGKQHIGSDDVFPGERGEIAAARASNKTMVDNFFETRATRDATMRDLDSNSWVVVAHPQMPKSIRDKGEAVREKWLATKKGQQYSRDLDHYWQSHADVALQFRSDPFMRHLMEVSTQDRSTIGSLDRAMEYWRTPEGRSYAKDMGLVSEEMRLERTRQNLALVQRYWPNSEALTVALSERATAAQFRAALGGMPDLPKIHGRVVHEAIMPDAYHGIRAAIFEWIGSRPDTALVRHPFYTSAWRREADDMYRVAAAQGLDLSDEKLIARIGETAHKRALKDLEDTIFTIHRYSNPASFLRFISPFFAAFENSLRTWAGIVVRDPSVLPRANTVWNIPNTLGMVVDEEGNPVPPQNYDFLTGSKGQFIQLPKFMQDVLGPISGNIPFVFPKGGLNVVFPGENPLLPGTGPIVSFPVGSVLAAKPDVAEAVRTLMGDAAYSQVAPLLNASGDIGDAFLPAWARKRSQYMGGDENVRYLNVVAAVTKDALTAWQLNGGRKEDMPTAQEIMDNVNAFYEFSEKASLGLPAAIMRQSAFPAQVAYWRSLMSQDLTMDERYRLFTDKFEDSYRAENPYRALTLSSWDSRVPGLDATTVMYNTMNDNRDLIRKIAAELGEDAIGVIAATVPEGDYNREVADWWAENDIPGKGAKWKTPATAESVTQDFMISDMWDEYNKERALRDTALEKAGLTKIDSAAAKESGMYALWQEFEQRMADKYQSVWTNFGPEKFRDKVPATLSTIAKTLNDEKFMSSELGQGAVWQGLKQYMEERKKATDAIRSGADKGFVQDMFDEWVSDWKMSHGLRLLDFYDRYLDNDNLSSPVGE